jgi:hypothetical protein
VANETGVPQYPAPLTGAAGITSAVAGAPYNCGGISSIIFEIYGTFVGTVAFQGTIDDGLSSASSGLNYPGEPNWFPVGAFSPAAGTTAVSTTTPGLWVITYPLSQFRLNITGYTSGTIYGVARGATTPASIPYTGASGGGGATNVNVLSIPSDGSFTTDKTVSVGTSATPILASNSARLGMWLFNNDLSTTVYVGGASVAVGSSATPNGGIALLPNGNLPSVFQMYTGPISGIVASGSAIVAVKEW